MRKQIVAGNWKMNNSYNEGLKLASEVVNMAKDELNDDVQLILVPPYIHLKAVADLSKENPNVGVGSQNASDKDSGAYTGEISVSMVKSTGAGFVVLGHSERREYFSESDMELAAKVDAVLKHDLTPIFCCGESLEIRESEAHFSYVTEQITNSLYHLTAEEISKVVIAYEPIWAIGTGLTASPEQAQEMHAEIRKHLAEKYGNDVAEGISILYGGSCKPSNAKEIFAGKDVDGGLIGGASLNSRDFIDIAKSF